MAIKTFEKQMPHNLLVASQAAPFEFTEAYKSLRTNLQYASLDRPVKKIVVTSSIPNEGKSTVCINLAITLAENGNRVLLVDADLRKPSVHQYLNLRMDSIGGLTSVLSGMSTVDKCIVHFNDIGINILAAGPIPPNPAEIFGSDSLKALVDAISDDFDYILFDTPPVSVVTDAAVLSRLCDGVILVVRQGFTTYEVALQSKENLAKVDANILGCVFNAMDVEKLNRAYKYYNYKKYGYSYTSSGNGAAHGK